MSKFKKLYRDFFGLNEAITKASQQDIDLQQDYTTAINDMNAALEKTKELTSGYNPSLDEAQLTNNITDYNGHVMYRLRDPQEATAVAKDLQRWTTKKGFTIIKHERSRSGLTGYFYFRLGEDPGSESQKIQGYFSQMPELVKFAFQAPISKKKPAPRRMPSKRKI